MKGYQKEEREPSFRCQYGLKYSCRQESAFNNDRAEMTFSIMS